MKLKDFYQIICICQKKAVPLYRKTKTTSLTLKNKTTMTQETIYLCYETDKWISRESKQLAYIGTDLEDCIAQLAANFELNEKNKEQLRTNNQTISQQGYGYIIEEERTNCFVNGF